jgi:hypothetical protein
VPPYDRVHESHVLYILLGGLLLTGLIVLAALSRHLGVGRPKTEEEHAGEEHEFAEGIREGHRRVPLFIVVMLVLLVLWAVGYTVFSGSHFPT